MFSNLSDYAHTAIGGSGVALLQVTPAVHSANLQDGMSIVIGAITILAQIFAFRKSLKKQKI